VVFQAQQGVFAAGLDAGTLGHEIRPAGLSDSVGLRARRLLRLRRHGTGERKPHQCRQIVFYVRWFGHFAPCTRKCLPACTDSQKIDNVRASTMECPRVFSGAAIC
jgi:hypothetical protein